MEHTLDQKFAERKRLVEQVQSVILELLRSPLLTVSIVDGLAAGAGADLALASDLVLVTGNTRVSLLYARLGLVPDTGFKLLEWRFGSRALLTYAESKTLVSDDLIRYEWAEIVQDMAEDKQLKRYLHRRFRHNSNAYASAKQIRNSNQFGDIDEQLSQVAHRQAEALGRKEVRDRLLHSASAQRAVK
jgi:2-(1,2-epoxy-1,2-dihydrophenyl)acetyl-CoA isomerase